LECDQFLGQIQPGSELGKLLLDLGNPPILDVLAGLAARWLGRQGGGCTSGELCPPLGEMRAVQAMFAQQRGGDAMTLARSGLPQNAALELH